jgi:lipid A ethanolaminephosphotransferase
MTKAPFWTSAKLVIFFSVFVTVVGNVTMYEKLFAWQAESGSDIFYVSTLIPFQAFLLIWIISFLTFHNAYRYVLSLLLLITALSSYFSDAYGVVIDRGMLINAMETNTAEARDLMSWQLLIYVVGIFILPTIWLFRVEVREQTLIRRMGSHFIAGITSLVIAILVVLSMSSFYASFF